ncbi:hypothetical protein ACQKPX_06105 [Photobacterium sp. DNB23_23_1]
MNKEIQKISCVNSAAFVMHFEVKTHMAAQDISLGSTGNYPVGQERTIDLSAVDGLEPGMEVFVVVKAVLGKTEKYKEKYTYQKNGLTQAFRVHGTTLNYTIQEL